MFTDFHLPADREPRRGVDDLGLAEARILWALRRLAVLQPLGAARCRAVHIALQQEFGDAGLGIEHLLRCWLVGLARTARRPLVIGEPACPLLLADEARLLAVLRLAGTGTAAAATALATLTGSPAAADLETLFAAVRHLAKVT